MNLTLLSHPVCEKLIRKHRLLQKCRTEKDLLQFLSRVLDPRDWDGILQFGEKTQKETTRIGAQVISYYSDLYPFLLSQIYDPPPVLYAIGNTDLLNRKSISVVGTRNPSLISELATYVLPDYLSGSEYGSFVSGMAIGIDKAITEAALDSGWPIIGVLGTAIDQTYPKENSELYERVKSSSNALLITEFPVGFQAAKWSFPKRNRIIAGLSDTTLIMEAPLKSGAMSTAYSAVKENREVFVFRHEEQEFNAGGLALLEEGANRLILEPAEFLIRKEDGLVSHSSNIPAYLADWTRKEMRGNYQYVKNGYYRVRSKYKKAS